MVIDPPFAVRLGRTQPFHHSLARLCGQVGGPRPHAMTRCQKAVTQISSSVRFLQHRKIARAAGCIVALIGLAALLGWVFDITFLKVVVPGYASMKANTAAGLVCCGISLLILSGAGLSRGRRILGVTLALLVIGVGSVTLAEYLLALDIGIDTWIIHDPGIATDALKPGRMSPTTAFCFTMVGCALVLGFQPGARRFKLPLLAGVAVTSIAIAGLALFGYGMHLLFGVSGWNDTGMAIHTAFSFVLIGTGLLCLAGGEGGVRWWLDGVTAGGFALGIASMLIAAGGSFDLTSKLQRDMAWVAHTQEVLREIEEISSGMAELESSQRGFVITGDEALLSRREKSWGVVYEDVFAVRQLTVDNPGQQQRLGELEPLLLQRKDFGEQTIEARRKGGFRPAQTLVESRIGINYVAHINSLLLGMRDEEEMLLDQRQKTAVSAASTTFLLLPVGAFLSLAMMSLGLFLLNEGVGKRTQAELAVREGEARLAGIVGSAMDAIVSVDSSHRIILFNEAAKRMFRCSSADAIGQQMEKFVPSRYRQTHRMFVRGLDTTGVAPRAAGPLGDISGLRADGEEFPIEASVSQIEVAEKQVVTVILRDITERRRAQEEILRLNADLEQRVALRTSQLESSNKELEAFAYSVSHDLRAPLRAIDGFSKMLAEDYSASFDAEGHRLMGVVQASARRMDQLISDLLSLSKLTRAEMKFVPVQMTMLVESVYTEATSAEIRARFQFHLSPLPEVFGDPGLLRQLWINLLSNAIKYTAPCAVRRIDVSGSLEAEGATFHIKDSGVGFDPRYVHKLFGAFQRLHTTEEFDGTGIGLAIVQRIVHRHGGRVWAEGQVNAGATIHFTIPHSPPR